MRSSKLPAADNNKGINGHIYTLYQRLYHALSLGSRVYDGKELKWQCADIEIQRLVVRSISSFLDCISGDTARHPLIKDSVADIVAALVWILQNNSTAISSMAANVVVKLINVVPNTLLQSYLLDLVHPLASLLSSHQEGVSIPCAIALNMIFSNLSIKQEKKIWDIQVETETVSRIVCGMREFADGDMSIDYFQEMATLLSTILHRWPPSRYPVWNDDKLLKLLEVMRVKPDISVKIVVLRLYSALALCGHGAKKLLENGEALLQMMVLCMGRSYPLSIRTEAFRLAQCLATNEQGFLRMMSLCCEPIVKAIIDGMSGWTSHSGKIANDEMSLLVEACRLSLINRWAGEHHDYFWKQGIDRVLFNLLLTDFLNGPSQQFLSLEEQISIAEEGLKANFLLGLRPYVWDLLGWLATHCREDFSPDMHGHDLKIDILISCTCIAFVDSVQKGCQIYQSDVADAIRSESASRAVLMMIYSPCKYIASKARVILHEIAKPISKECLTRLLHLLNIKPSKDNFGMPNRLQTTISLVSLVCYSGLPQYQSHIVKNGGIKTLVDWIMWCISNDIHMGRLSLAPHLHNTFSERTCCWVCKEDWEGNDILLLYGLWGLAELINSGSVRNNVEIFSGQLGYAVAQFVSTLQEICSNSTSPGIKWYAALVLSYFGLYGFPCKLGRRIGKALNVNICADMQLILTNGETMNVHSVIFAVRCPSLLPPEELPHDGSSVGYDTKRKHRNFQKEIRLSSHVDNQALAKLLEFVYLGYLNAGEELVKKVKILARRCGLRPLLMMLGRIRPKWGALFPRYELAFALSPAGHRYSDIVLEAKATKSICWTCSLCSQSVPHMHCHKVVLWSSCDYLRALFQSGMLESDSETIKVPVSWEAMTKFVNWCYTDELPSPPSGCLWDNMDTEERLSVLQPYLELFWLAEFWFLEDVQDISYRVIISYLDSARHLSIKIIKIAADLSLWKLVEVAAIYLAPLYRQLCHSGDLEALDEEVVDMIRAASVRLSQEG
ncbi:BTB/POZ domain-containing protein At1g04390 isoform X2 [Jatropha curcas]|nr:BTB/POZ domain-containing protein At1g04390 isoform X2 [Jatropha curcas]